MSPLVWMAMLALSAAPAAAPDAGASGVMLDEAVARLERGEAREAVGVLLSHVRRGDLDDADRARAATVFFAAAAALDSGDSEDDKAAAVAADAAATLAGTPEYRARAAAFLVRYAHNIVDDDSAGALALARRARAFDDDNADARALESSLVGQDTWTVGHATLFGSVGLLALSATAFVVGLEQERQLRSAPHRQAEVDVLLLRRAVAAGVAWPTLAAGVGGLGLGTALVVSHDPGPAFGDDVALPQPFPPIASTVPVSP